MRTGMMTALLLLGLLAPVTVAAACPDPVAVATAVVHCAASAVNPDGEVTVWDGHPQQTFVDTSPACLN